MPFHRTLLAGLLALTGWSAQGQTASGPPVSAASTPAGSVSENQRPLRMAFSAGALSSTDSRRATLVMGTMARYLAGEIGYKPEVKLFESDDVLFSSVRQGMADLFMITGGAYARLVVEAGHVQGEIVDIQPLVMLGGEKSVDEPLVLLTRGSRKLSQLKGTRILVDIAGRGDLPLVWLDSLLHTANLDFEPGSAARTSRPRDSYFGRIDLVNNPSRAILPLFFGKADAAVVRQREFEEALALNPQLKQFMAVAAYSPKLVDSLICVRRDAPLARHLLDVIKNLDDSATKSTQDRDRGRQLLKLLNVDRFVSYEPRALIDTVELVSHADSSLPSPVFAGPPRQGAGLATSDSPGALKKPPATPRAKRSSQP